METYLMGLKELSETSGGIENGIVNMAMLAEIESRIDARRQTPADLAEILAQGAMVPPMMDRQGKLITNDTVDYIH